MVIIEGFNPPRTFEAAKDLLAAGSLHTFWMRVLDSKKDAIAAVVVSKDPYVSMREAVMKAFEELPATFGVIAQAARSNEIKEWAMARLATWTDTQINVSRHKRLEAALNESNLSAEQMKLVELLPASLIAFDDWQQNETFRGGAGGKSYVSRTANVLAETGSEQAQKNERGKPPKLEYIDPQRPEYRGEDPDLVAAEVKLDVEHNRRLLKKIERHARLTKRQRQVYELDKAGCQEAEIAVQLGMAGSTVRVYRKDALDALRRAARKLGLLG